MAFNSIGALKIGPVTSGRYAFDEGNEALIEKLINTWAAIIGFAKVPVDGFLDTTDADRMVRVQRFIFEKFVCGGPARENALAKLEDDLDQAADFAREEASGTGQVVTAEQMWVSLKQDGIISKLPGVNDRVASGELKRCPEDSLFTTKNILIAGVAIGALWMVTKG